MGGSILAILARVLFAGANASGVASATEGVRALHASAARYGRLWQNDPDLAQELSYVVRELAPKLGVRGVTSGMSSLGMTTLLNGYFTEAGLAVKAELVPGSAFLPSDLKIVNGRGGVIVKRLRYNVGDPGEVGSGPADGIHFLLAVGYQAPDRVAFRDPVRKDGRSRTDQTRPSSSSTTPQQTRASSSSATSCA